MVNIITCVTLFAGESHQKPGLLNCGANNLSISTDINAWLLLTSLQRGFHLLRVHCGKSKQTVKVQRSNQTATKNGYESKSRNSTTRCHDSFAKLKRIPMRSTLSTCPPEIFSRWISPTQKLMNVLLVAATTPLQNVCFFFVFFFFTFGGLVRKTP